MFTDQLEKFGGSAFPFVVENGDGSTFICAGMTLRDFTAIKAMESMMVNANRNGIAFDDREGISAKAYAQADAMLEARNK